MIVNIHTEQKGPHFGRPIPSTLCYTLVLCLLVCVVPAECEPVVALVLNISSLKTDLEVICFGQTYRPIPCS